MRRRQILPFLVLALAGALAPRKGGACTRSWNGDAGDGFRTSKENWTGNVLPGAGDDVCIGAAFGVALTPGNHTVRSLTSDGSLTILGGSLEFAAASRISGTLALGSSTEAGETFHGTGPLTTGGRLNWFDVTMSGSGVTGANGGDFFAGQLDKSINGRTFNNNGAASWSGTGNIGLGLSGTESRFNSNGTFNVANDDLFVHTGGGTQGFFDVGTFTKSATKSASAGLSSFLVPFSNTGTVRMRTGDLALDAGGTGTGAFATASDAQVTAGAAPLAAQITSRVVAYSGDPAGAPWRAFLRFVALKGWRRP
jgi:hypothetical protein